MPAQASPAFSTLTGLEEVDAKISGSPGSNRRLRTVKTCESNLYEVASSGRHRLLDQTWGSLQAKGAGHCGGSVFHPSFIFLPYSFLMRCFDVMSSV